MNPLLQIIAVVTPLVLQGIAKIQADRAAAQQPALTPVEMEAALRLHFEQHIDAILAQGAAWTTSHPKDPQ